MKRSAAYPAAMAANHAPTPTCSFSSAAVCSQACSAGPRIAARVRTASSQVWARPSRRTALKMTPAAARTTTRPAQYQVFESTDRRELVCATGARMVRLKPLK